MKTILSFFSNGLIFELNIIVTCYINIIKRHWLTDFTDLMISSFYIIDTQIDLCLLYKTNVTRLLKLLEINKLL